MAKDQITFMLLEKKDQPKVGQGNKCAYLKAGHNACQALGYLIESMSS